MFCLNTYLNALNRDSFIRFSFDEYKHQLNFSLKCSYSNFEQLTKQKINLLITKDEYSFFQINNKGIEPNKKMVTRISNNPIRCSNCNNIILSIANFSFKEFPDYHMTQPSLFSYCSNCNELSLKIEKTSKQRYLDFIESKIALIIINTQIKLMKNPALPKPQKFFRPTVLISPNRPSPYPTTSFPRLSNTYLDIIPRELSWPDFATAPDFKTPFLLQETNYASAKNLRDNDKLNHIEKKARTE